MFRLFLSLAATVVLGFSAFAQDAVKPGPEHELLKKHVGTWTTTMSAGGMDAKGSVTFKMELGGLWLIGDMQSELFGMKFNGKSMDSYDQAKKKYVSVWADSMSTGPVITEGTYNPEKKTLTMTGEGPGMDGKTSKYKSVTEFKDDDTFIMTMYMGDTKEASFVVTYKRKK
ncbi:MAG: DUF1579 domain-containing protein [Gemmataceae bacterium]